MNMHLPQNLQTRYEIENLTFIPTQIISPKSSEPIIHIQQDSLTGALVFTLKDANVNEKTLMNIMMSNKEFDNVLPKPIYDVNGIRKYSPSQTFSLILPDINTKIKPIIYDELSDNKNLVQIENGVMLHGILDKNSLGGKMNGLISIIYAQYGQDTCKNFLDNTQNLITKWLSGYGFTIGCGDAIPKKDVVVKVKDIIVDKLTQMKTLIKQANMGLYKPNLSQKFINSSFEEDILNIMNKIRDETQKIVKKNINSDNGFYCMINSGAKGNNDNINNIMGLIGQQSIDGGRVPISFNNRTLPCFHRDDYGAESRGFIKNSIINGLEPHEFFFGLMAGRTGLIDTAIKTAESGYIERRMVKAMEDLTVTYDGTVRTGANSIVQFAYGDDSIDPIKLTKQNMIILDKNNEQLQKMYAFNELDMKTLENLTDKKVWDEISKMDKAQLNEDYEEIKNYRDIARTKFFFKNNTIMDSAIKIPVNFDNIVSTSIVKFNLQKYHKSDLSPKYIREQINNKLNEFKEFVNEDSLTIFEIMVKSFLSIKKCLLEYKLNKQVFDFIIETITNRFLSSFIQPGEAVGVLAAQSVGEPVSQLTLKSFHKAGLGVNTGAPRMKEVIEYSKKIKNPQLIIYLKDEYARNKDHAKYVMSQIEYTQLQDLVIKTEILYENTEQNMLLEEDQEFIKSYYKFAKLIGLDECTTDDLSSWVLRIEFDKEALLNKNILINDIQELIMNNHNLDSDVQCIFTDDNAKNLVLRIRVREEEGEGDLISFLQELEKTLMSITVRGISGIENVNMQSNKKLKYNADGSHLQEEEWVLYTKGVNLIDTLCNEYIDPSRTISSDMTEIYETFGIEATRQYLINTFNDILSEYYLDQRHLSLLADVMTFRGQIMPIMRHGINRTPETGPLAKASFEMVTDVLYKAATYAEVDKMNGISGNIMMGQFIPAGTNAFDVLFDEVKYMKELENVKETYEAEMMENKMEEEDPISLIKKKVDSKMSQFKTTNINKEFDLKFDITAIPEFKI
jgi:DNA-directed RNA polymerase II subunit RPB1